MRSREFVSAASSAFRHDLYTDGRCPLATLDRALRAAARIEAVALLPEHLATDQER